MVLQLLLPIHLVEAVPWERPRLRPIPLVVLLPLHLPLPPIHLAARLLLRLLPLPIRLAEARWKVVAPHRLPRRLLIRSVHPPRHL